MDMVDAIDVADGQQDVGDKLELIKSQMPETYAGIRHRAGELGNDVYALVRRGLRGEPNCFYAAEGGHVVGTPFLADIMAELAAQLAEFRSTSFALYGSVGLAGPVKGAQEGTNKGMQAEGMNHGTH